MIPPLPAFAPPPLPPRTATLDFETYSEAGYCWQADTRKWGPLPGVSATKKGLKAVGMRVYAEHPTAEVVTMSYRLPGHPLRRWNPSMPPPADLFAHIAAGGLVEAHNAGFEQTIWLHVCQRKYGWPTVPPRQWRCSAAKARALGLPPSLEKLGEALRLPVQKDPEGKRLMRVFSMPRNPTKTDPRTRYTRADKPDAAEAYDRYCDRDVEAEEAASERMAPLIPDELEFWLCDQAVNRRGIGIDRASVEACCDLVAATLDDLNARCVSITGATTSEVQQLIGWLAAHGVHTGNLDDDAIGALLDRDDLPETAREVLQLRRSAASASVKKVFAMRAHTTADDRVCDLFVYHGASTGRDTHQDVQPGNLPKSGPALRWCESDGCGKPYGRHLDACPWCGTSAAFSRESGWTWEAAEDALWLIRTTRSPDAVRMFLGDPLLAVSGCVRSLFRAAPDHDLISSDYSSIEAVVAACLAGEQWRIDAFHRREDIYLHGAAGITGKTYDWYLANGGKKHPDRQKIGKPGELGLGFGGWVSAWRAFGGEGEDDEVKAKIIAWREASPAIVEMWGGQVRGKPWAPDYAELFGLEGMAISAVLEPGRLSQYRQIGYIVEGDCLFCVLPSGRRIAYQEPRLAPGKWDGQWSLSYMTWNTNPTMGPIGWIRKDTYSGRLFENVVQATARDVMRDAVIRLERSGYPVVLRVHDELASEVPKGFGSIAEYERLMEPTADWCRGWPIRADGGWRGERYRKAD